ncbi:MAG TPA: FtsX-like permease family protein [Candidatus Limnocylindrales bacterium]|nr:FtsX-like permease family protein [Candidatus Limnocylindrales bacterium]
MTLLRLALRDLMHQRAFALFFIANLALGLSGALLLDSLQGSIERTLHARSRAMLGADVRIASMRPLQPDEIARMDADSPAAASCDLVQMYSMAAGRHARLVELRGIDARFPLAGSIVLAGGGAVTPAHHQRLEKEAQAWADPALLGQLGIELGDTVRIGSLEVRITDTLARDTGLSLRAASLAPRLYVALSRIAQTELVQTGSRVEYQHLQLLPRQADADAAARRLRASVSDARVRITSHGEAAAEISGAYTRVTRYLGLVSLCALALAAVACAYLFHVFLRRRLPDLAILMSLGARRRRAQVLLLLELVVLAGASAIVACAVVAAALPAAASAFADVLPRELTLGVGARETVAALVVALLVGPVSCLGMLARLDSLQVSELFQEQATLHLHRKRLQALWHVPAALVFLVLAVWRAGDLRQGAYFVGVVAVAFLIAAALGRVILPAAARLGERSSVPVRLALRQLAPHRRGSVTAFVALALAALLLGLPPQLRALLAAQLDPPEEGAIPSLFLFDIQPEQTEPLREHVRTAGVELQRVAPMVRARLQAINGDPVAGEVAAAGGRRPGAGGDVERMQARTYNLTWQQELAATETLVAGMPFSGSWDGSGVAEISVEKGFARRLDLSLGDTMRFDVQGVPVEGRIVNLREVDWTSLQPNFFVAFQPGVLEGAPAVFLASVPSLPREQRERLQASIVERFPNVSMIDVTRGVERALDLLQQLQWAVSATAWTALAVGLALIFAIARDEADQRRWDLNLTKVLGAPHSLLRASVAIEFAALGVSAAIVGCTIGVAGCAVLATTLLEAELALAWPALLGVVAGLPFLTALTARMAMRGVLQERPLLSLQA